MARQSTSIWRPWFARQSTTAPACPASQATRKSLGGGFACPSRAVSRGGIAHGAAASAGAMLALHAGTVCLCAQMLDRAGSTCAKGGGGLFSTYQAWSQLSYATIRLDPFGIPPSACPLVDTVTRRSRARARLPGPAVGGEGKGGCMFRTLCLSKLTRPASRCRFKSLHSTACESGCSTG
jgi:hypothetical protein